MYVHTTNYELNQMINRLTTNPVTQYRIDKAKKQCREEAGHICQLCGLTSGFGLQIDAHHILPANLYPGLADVLRNLVALCRPCHFLFGHFGNWKHFNKDLPAGIVYFRKIYAAEKGVSLATRRLTVLPEEVIR